MKSEPRTLTILAKSTLSTSLYLDLAERRTIKFAAEGFIAKGYWSDVLWSSPGIMTR